MLTHAVAADDAALAVLFVDIADLSKFQARLGFAESAAVLHALFEAFIGALGVRARVLRLGEGSFFAIVGGMRNKGHAVLAAEKLQRTSDEVFGVVGVAVKPALSIGVSLFPTQATEPEPLLRQAQLAAEAAHSRGTRVLLFDDACSAEVLASWTLGNAFAQALDTGELSVYYQPKISMATGRPVGVEALMRWLRDGKPVASPDVFIPLAEEAGLIHATTWYSLSNAIRVSAECGALPVAINITPAMLHHREFMQMIRTAVTMWDIKAPQLTLEVTEGALIADFEQATARLKALRDLGLRISIDDFGTGYSSLSYFKKIPADELKIDKSFVLNMATDLADQRLVHTIIALAHHFNLKIVAEGVENRATFDALTDMGCHQAQGFLFSPALSPERLKEWLDGNSRDLRLARPAG